MKYYLVLALLACSLTLTAQPKLGETAPEISLPDAKGNVESLSALKGKIVLIDFWASWCGPCIRSLPQLKRLYAKYKSKGFEIYGISLDDDKADWTGAIQKHKIPWKQVNEPGGWNAPVSNAWKIEQIPTAYLLDQDGKIIEVDPSPGALEKALHKLLK